MTMKAYGLFYSRFFFLVYTQLVSIELGKKSHVWNQMGQHEDKLSFKFASFNGAVSCWII